MQTILLGIFEHFQTNPGGPVVSILFYLIILLAFIMLMLKYFGTSKKQKQKNLLAKTTDDIKEKEILPEITTDDFQKKEILPGVYSFNHSEGTLIKISTGYKKLVDTLKAGEYQKPTLNSEEFSFFG